MPRRVWADCSYCGASHAKHLRGDAPFCTGYVGDVSYRLAPTERALGAERRERQRGIVERGPRRLGRAVATAFRARDPLAFVDEVVADLEHVAALWRARIAGDLVVARLHRYDERMSMSGDPECSRRELARVEFDLGRARAVRRAVRRAHALAA